jgi:O-antigen/teichoic acid export membrane protein
MTWQPAGLPCLINHHATIFQWGIYTNRPPVLFIRKHGMKYINYGFLLGSIILFFVGLVFWLAKSQIDYAAFFFALAAVGQGSYLLATKADKTK